jgi:hypothetical protein
MIDWENKEVVGKIQLTVSDPKTLTPVNFLLIPEY